MKMNYLLGIFGLGAVFDAILVPSQVAPTKITNLATVTASSEIASFGANEIFAINASGDITIRFGPAGSVPTPDANSFRIPSNTTMVFDVGRQWTSFKVFNITGGNVNVYIQPLSKF